MKSSLFFLVFIFLFSCTMVPETGYKSEYIRYSGRVELNDSTAVFYWPGNAVLTRFKGTEIQCNLWDLHGKNYFNVIIDEDSVILFFPDTLRQWKTVAEGLKDTIHTLQLFQRNVYGPSFFTGFRLNKGGKFLSLPPIAGRSMEFYGNSITEGASVHDYSGKDRWDSTFTDNYVAYGAVTARHYQANYTCIARGGIGLLVSWYPLIMPEMWDRLTPDDPASKWDFSKYTPDIVVINLFQNDAALFERPEHPQMISRFGGKIPPADTVIQAYVRFLRNIREKYPDASIICTLGCMNAVREDKPWRGYVKEAVEKMHDPRIYDYFFFYKGGFTHPQVEEQRRMADSLIRFIDKHITW